MLLIAGGRRFAITCAHVIEAYRAAKEADPHTVFQLGNVSFDPTDRIHSINCKIDIAVLRISDADLPAAEGDSGIGDRTVEARMWPPNDLAEGDVIMFGGFPGALRQQHANIEISHGTFSAAGIRVAASRPDDIVCQLEREHWVRSFAEQGLDEDALRDLGGLSGCPVFVDRGLHWEFGGVVYEASAEFDLLRIRPARLIASDGTLLDA